MAIGALMWVALDPLIIGGMDFGQLMAFMTAASTLAKPMRTLAGINALLQQGVVAAKSIFSVLGEDAENDSGVQSMKKAHGDIQIQNLFIMWKK